VPIGHGFSFFGHGKSMLKKRGHPGEIFLVQGAISAGCPSSSYHRQICMTGLGLGIAG